MSLTTKAALELLEHHTGIVIPTYFNTDTDTDFAYALLSDTVHMFVREVADPQSVCLSVDGPGPALAIAQRVARQYNTGLVQSERNRGKLGSVRNGMKALLPNRQLRYFAAVDQDGDHFANELLNFVRSAEHVADTLATDQVIVLGNRLSRQRPLGFLRGEQEELADRVLLDALHYDAAHTGKPLVWQFANATDDLPDFHSGYKFFSRATAEQIFQPEPNLAGCEERVAYRHACEAVMTVEALQSGATLAVVSRRTYDEQPVSVFARLDRSQLAADMIIWPCKRLNVPGHFVAQWLTNHLHRLLLGTLVPQGRDELLAIRERVLAAFDLSLAHVQQSADELMRSRFI
jgi:hypothetical protein